LLTLCHTTAYSQFRNMLYNCLTVVFISWCAIAMITSGIMIIVPNWYGTTWYNLLVGGAMLVISIAVKVKGYNMAWFKHVGDENYVIALEFILLLFLCFVLPSYFPVIATNSVRQWGVFVLTFMIVMTTIGLMVNRMKNLVHSHQLLLTQITHEETYRRQTQLKFDEIMILKHYYNKLYHSILPFIRKRNMNGLESYFKRYIAPIHKKRIMVGKQLSGVKNELIHNLMLITCEQVSAREDIDFEIDISTEIVIAEDYEMEIFEILSNFTDNAIKEVAEQKNGLVRIEAYQLDGVTSISVTNTLRSDIDIASFYQIRQANDRHGYGLRRVRDIVYKRPEFEHHTYKSGMYKDKRLLVQHIIITDEMKEGALYV